MVLSLDAFLNYVSYDIFLDVKKLKLHFIKKKIHWNMDYMWKRPILIFCDMLMLYNVYMNM